MLLPFNWTEPTKFSNKQQNKKNKNKNCRISLDISVISLSSLISATQPSPPPVAASTVSVHLYSFTQGLRDLYCKSNEAYCEDCDAASGNFCFVDRALADISISTELYLVATYILHRVVRMLWSVNGWSRFDAVSNLPSRSYAVAAGYC